MAGVVYEIAISAWLHDIGKLLHRAYGSPEQIPWTTCDTASSLSLQNHDPPCIPEHVLFTSAFFDLLRQNGIIFPAGIQQDRIKNLACFHHQSDDVPDPALAWICSLANQYSAGMSTKADKANDSKQKDKDFYRKTPLQSIFDEVILYSDRKSQNRHAYHGNLLNVYDPDVLLPVNWDTVGAELPDQYNKMWQVFRDGFEKLICTPNISADLFENALMGLLERTTWCFPTSADDDPCTSLFDHLKTTAAIASVMYQHHQAVGDVADLVAIKNGTRPKFRFLAGDLSGIQSTLFTLESQGVKGVNKILRARSFMLSAIVESAAIQSLRAFSLPSCCLIQMAGGRFIILVPEVKYNTEIVAKLARDFDKWLLDTYTGSLAMNLSLSDSFAGNDFHMERFHDVLANLNKHIESTKQRPLATCQHGILPREFPLNRVCSTCGTRPAEKMQSSDQEQIYRCTTCNQEEKTGRQLPHSDFLVWGNMSGADTRFTDVLGIDLRLVNAEKLPPQLSTALSIHQISQNHIESVWPHRYLANYIPRFKDKEYLSDPRYEGIDTTEAGPEKPKTFAHIAAEAFEITDQKELIGKPYLALLKADVDHLGFIFSHGLKRENSSLPRITISSMAQMSRMMDLYFSGYLQGLIRREFPSTYTVYAGGDDLLLIGPWRQSLHLATRMQESFSAFTGRNAHITISAGLSLFHANHPVNRAVQDAERLLETAKESGRNRICAMFDQPVEWNQYRQRLEDAQWIHDQMHNINPVSTGFVYQILSLAQDAESAAKGDITKANWLSRLAYHLARNIHGEKDQKMRTIKAWLERLGFNDQLKLVGPHSNINNWRLPITIALYRNRS